MSVPAVRPVPTLVTPRDAARRGRRPCPGHSPLPTPPPLAPPPRLFALRPPHPSRVLLPPPLELNNRRRERGCRPPPHRRGRLFDGRPRSSVSSTSSLRRRRVLHDRLVSPTTTTKPSMADRGAPARPPAGSVHPARRLFLRTEPPATPPAAGADPFMRTSFLRRRLAWRPVRCFQVPATEAPGDATLTTGWSRCAYMPRRTGGPACARIRPVAAITGASASITACRRAGGSPTIIRSGPKSSGTSAGTTPISSTTTPHLVFPPVGGRMRRTRPTQALQLHLAVDVNASGDRFYGFNRQPAASA